MSAVCTLGNHSTTPAPSHNPCTLTLPPHMEWQGPPSPPRKAMIRGLFRSPRNNSKAPPSLRSIRSNSMASSVVVPDLYQYK
uniref:Uncharacterized protein n=1 Tax=Chelonoidis abingdonii TaxID=106734 RepID=A0A8C0GBK9_CHEAB